MTLKRTMTDDRWGEHRSAGYPGFRLRGRYALTATATETSLRYVGTTSEAWWHPRDLFGGER